MSTAARLALGVVTSAHAYVALSAPPEPRGAALRTPRVIEHLREAVGQTWTTDDGLPSIVTLALAQSHEGLVWAGTEHGLARFDGRTITTVLERVSVNALLPVDRGLWVGTSEGLAYVIDGQLEHGPHEEAFGKTPVRSLAASGSRLYVGTSTGVVSAFEGGRIVRSWSAAEGIPAATVTRLLAFDGRLAVGTEHGLRFVDTANDRVEAAPSPLAGTAITGLALEGSTLLVSTFDRGLFRCTGATCAPVPIDGLDANPHLGQPLVFGSGELLLPTASALVVVREGAVVERYTESAGALAALFVDRDGALWVGTGNDGKLNGLRVLRHRGVSVWLRGRDGRAVLEQRDGSVLLATNSEGLFRRSADGVETPVPLAIPDLRSVRSIQADAWREGGVLVAGLGGAIRVAPNGDQERLTTGPLASTRIRAVRALEDGRVVFGTQAGLVSGRPGEAFDLLPGAASTWFVVGLASLPDGSWLVPTSDTGLWRLPREGGEARTVALAAGVGSVGRPLVHASGRVIVPHDAGVCVLDPSLSVARCLGAASGFATKGHVGLVDDQRGQLWISHTGGVSTVTWAELFEVASASSRPEAPLRTLRHLTTRDGLPSNGCNGGDPNTVRLANGRVAVACMGGFAIIDPETATPDPRPPSTFVHEVDVDGDRRRDAFTAPLPANTQRVTFSFGAPSFLGNPRAQRYLVKLEGFDRDWSEADPNALRASYTNLPRGRTLRFLVKAANNDGVWNEEPAAVPFTVAPKLHERLSVQLLALGALVGLVTAAYKARVRVLKARARELEGLVADRTVALEGALRELRDDLREARRFQELTMGALPSVEGFELASRWLPASTVGGDLLLTELRGGGFRVLLVDATGHGVQAALRTMVIKTAFEAVTRVSETPGELLTSLNATLVGSYGEFEAKTDAVAADFVRTPEGAWVVRVATAGSMSLALREGDTTEELRVPGFALGVTADRRYATLERSLATGAMAVLVTDGILEQPNLEREAFEWERFVRACHAETSSAEACAESVVAAWNGHRCEAPQSDDATVVVIAKRAP